MNPPMVTPKPVLTEARVEMFVTCAVGGSNARPPMKVLGSGEKKNVDDPFGATFLIDLPENSPMKRFPSRSKASDRGAFSAGLYMPKVPRKDPLDEYFRIVLLLRSATYRLPAPSNARPSGRLSPLEINELTLPFEVILTITPLCSATSRLPARSQANRVGAGVEDATWGT